MYVDLEVMDRFEELECIISNASSIPFSHKSGIDKEEVLEVINNTKEGKVKTELQKQYDQFIKNLKATTKTMMYKEGCILSISELYDSKPPYLPKGAFSQAWSVAEIFRILLDSKTEEEEVK